LLKLVTVLVLRGFACSHGFAMAGQVAGSAKTYFQRLISHERSGSNIGVRRMSKDEIISWNY